MGMAKAGPRLQSSMADLAAIGLSGLCILHCLALPVLGAVLPLFGVWAEQEWVHQVFVLLALPISVPLIIKRARLPQSGLLTALAIAGLVCLIGGAFFERLHTIETPLTITGAVLLSSAHLVWWQRHRNAPPA